jgi:2-keto-4-pentenoate hydratase
MGNPINAVAWLANTLHRYGVMLEARHVVLSGSFIKAIPFDAGDTVTALFDTLGEVSFTAT